ncbi:MAG: Arm DNA-binding domain-containing protein [Bradyrhizobium sp.]
MPLRAEPPAKRYELSDGEGLYLSVETNGGLYWRYKYRVAGQERLMALGQFDAVSLGKAVPSGPRWKHRGFIFGVLHPLCSFSATRPSIPRSLFYCSGIHLTREAL